MESFEPSENQMGTFFTRATVSRAVITGTLQRYTLQSSVTVDEILIAPTMNEQQRGSVNSMLNMTLLSVQQPTEQFEAMSNPIELGSLVYRFDKPYSDSNEVRQSKQFDHQTPLFSAESKMDFNNVNTLRTKRAINRGNMLSTSRFEDSSISNDEQYWQQEQPRLSEAPQSPLLPFTVGFEGQSFKKQHNVVEYVRKLAQQIGQEMQETEKIPQQNTVGKYVILTSLLRTLNQNEMQQVATALYTKQQDGAQGAAWTTLRDAIAQCGTGPALLSIQEWIKTDKIQDEEAADIISTAAHAARQPTEEYMRSFFQMIKTQEVMEKKQLNESVVFAFTKLAHEVYVNREQSHAKFPVHAFGSFRTESGKNFLKNEVIVYLTQKLHESIAHYQTEKIHVYIRALGNVGHQQILEAFEPYLEGKKQCSQFQRVLMVVAMDKLVNAELKVARSVLYKIYQNPTEYEQVRVAAVYQLMRTVPSADMLQRMATYTNADASEYVNSAVKSVIESAAELQGHQHAQLRIAALSALPLLTKKHYGQQYSNANLRSYVVEQINTVYKQTVQTFGAEDSILPKGIKYALRGNFGGVNQRLVDMHAMVSSIDDLINVLEHQTESFHHQKQHKQSQRSEQQQQWSVENIAKLLNMQGKQREQLEGNLFLQLGSLQKMFAFDNHTIEMLPHVLRKIEECLNTGKHFHHQKMMISNEIAIAFPTQTGFPFIYTYDRPTFIRFEGRIRASAQPEIASGNVLKKPEVVESEFEIRALVSGRSQAQLAFITPFDNQRYSAGYDKNFQVNVPLSGKIHLDLVNEQIKTEIRPLNNERNTELLHFSTWPYTSQDDIFAIEPKKQIIRMQHQHQVNTVVGQKTTGIALKLEASLDQPITVAWIYEKFQRHDLISALLSPWVDERIQNNRIVLRLDSELCSTDKIVAQFGYQQKYQEHRQEEHNQGADISKFDQISEEPLKRQAEFMKRAGSDIQNANTRVFDANVEFYGQQQIKYIATLAYAKSNVDSKGRVLIQLKKNHVDGKQLRLYLSAKTQIPNTNGLDLTYAMKFDPTSTTQVHLSIGENFESATQIKAQIKHKKSEERQQYLMELPEYQECKRQMQESNHQLAACAKMTAIANLLDQFTIKVDYENMKLETKVQLYKWYSALRYTLFPHVEEHMLLSNQQNTQQNQNVEIIGQFQKDLRRFNLKIHFPHGQIEMKDLTVNTWAKNMFVPHPVFPVSSRLMGHYLGFGAYRPFCVLDKQAVTTFDNKTYPAELPNQWAVLLQYVPRRAAQRAEQQHQTIQQQLKEQVENYVVLARESGSQKEVKMIVQTPQTQGKLVEFNLKPVSGQQYPKLYINGEEVKYTSQQATNIYGEYIQVYGLPNGEVKIELYNAFYVIYDGVRVKVTVVETKFRDSVRGLCGTFTGEQQTDFLSARNCILHHPQEFVASYTILEQGQSHTQQMASLKERVEKERCIEKKVMYSNVISAIDTGRMLASTEYKGLLSRSGSCTKLQTQYVVEGNEVCFTIRPLPVCKSTCQRRGSVFKTISVHCVQQTGATDLWMNQIQKGASPDFALKSQSRTIRMEIPQTCFQ